MFYKDEVLNITDGNGVEKEYAILVTFDIEVKDKSYVLYTDYEKDECGNMKIYASVYDKDWNLFDLTDSDEIDYVEEYIRYLNEDFEDGIDFA